ncbi:hypothetical protein T484DRAFT_1881360, partial [Baffinella frigidus]
MAEQPPHSGDGPGHLPPEIRNHHRQLEELQIYVESRVKTAETNVAEMRGRLNEIRVQVTAAERSLDTCANYFQKSDAKCLVEISKAMEVVDKVFPRHVGEQHAMAEHKKLLEEQSAEVVSREGAVEAREKSVADDRKRAQEEERAKLREATSKTESERKALQEEKRKVRHERKDLERREEELARREEALSSAEQHHQKQQEHAHRRREHEGDVHHGRAIAGDEHSDAPAARAPPEGRACGAAGRVPGRGDDMPPPQSVKVKREEEAAPESLHLDIWPEDSQKPPCDLAGAPDHDRLAAGARGAGADGEEEGEGEEECAGDFRDSERGGGDRFVPGEEEAGVLREAAAALERVAEARGEDGRRGGDRFVAG